MRYTVDLEKETITVYGYEKKWKKYLAVLEKLYVDKKGFSLQHQDQDANENSLTVNIGDDYLTNQVTWTSGSGTTTINPTYYDSGSGTTTSSMTTKEAIELMDQLGVMVQNPYSNFTK